MEFLDFVAAQLPKPPARISFTGGRRIWSERLRAYELVDEPPYDARVIAAWHSDWGDLLPELDAAADVLPPYGSLFLEVVVPELLDRPTLEWFHAQQRVLAAATGWESAPRTPDESRAWLDVWYRTVPLLAELREGLEQRFAERGSALVPGLHKHLGPAAPVLERTLVDARAIRPVTFRYAGVRRPG